jgi:hypothetical protein
MHWNIKRLLNSPLLKRGQPFTAKEVVL